MVGFELFVSLNFLILLILIFFLDFFQILLINVICVPCWVIYLFIFHVI